MNNDAEFIAWQSACDRLLIRRFGLGADDLPDWHWRDSFDDGLTPAEAVECYVEDEAYL